MGMLQLLITVWVGIHPITYTVPHMYARTDDACQHRAASIFAHRINRHQRMTIECVPAVGSQA